MSVHKRLIFVLFIGLFLTISCNQNVKIKDERIDNNVAGKEQAVEGEVYPEFKFVKETHDFGQIAVGEIVVCDFYFKNIGQDNLIIKTIESSCGCTNIKWKKQPIKVGEESKITVEFDSKKRYGKQYKVLTIFANTKRQVKELRITATIK